MTQKIYYWDGLIVDEKLLDCYQPLFRKLQDGDYKAADLDLKKLPGHQLFSVKINDTHRLLLTTFIARDKKRYLVVLGEVLNHDYQKSPFLKPAVLAAFLEKKGSQLIDQALVNEEAFLTFDGHLLEPMTSDNEQLFAIEPVNFFNQQFIQLNTAQQQICSAKLPVLIAGAAGSGKTCVALSLLAQTVEQLRLSDEKKTLLYITQSPDLLQHIKALWQAHPCSQHLAQTTTSVEFKTYLDLLAPQSLELVGELHFQMWFADYQRKHKPNDNVVHDAAKIYQEFRLIAGYDYNNYLNLGQRQSLYKESAQRTWLWAAYQAYLQTLAKQYYDPAFTPLTNQTFHTIVVDEAADFSYLQLRSLAHAAQHARIAFCLDNHQSLMDSFSKRNYLASLFPHQSQHALNSVDLPGSYRCPGEVIHFANNVLALKFLLAGGVSDKKDIRSISDNFASHSGSIRWLEPNSQTIVELMAIVQQQTNSAIITLPHLKEQVKNLLATPLVFTISEIKGLEYNNIVAFNLFNQSLLEQASRQLSRLAPEKKPSSNINRAKAGSGDSVFNTVFNELFTAFTRTTANLIIVQEPDKKLTQLIKTLQQPLAITAINPHDLNTLKTQTATEQDWEHEAKKLIKQGFIQQANAIFTEKLHRSASDFHAFSLATTSVRPVLTKKTSTLTATKPALPATIPTPKNQPPKVEQIATIQSINILANEKSLIKSITRNLSLKNLTKFFQHHDWQHLLFHYHYQQERTAFEYLTSHNDNVEIFLSFLKNNPALKETITNLLFDIHQPNSSSSSSNTQQVLNMPLLNLIHEPAGLTLWHHLITSTSGEQQQLIGNILCRSYCPLLFNNYSPLYSLMETKIGRLSLLKLLIECPDIGKAIALQLVPQLDLLPASKENSILYYLCISKAGHEIFYEFLNHNKNLALQIPTELVVNILFKPSAELTLKPFYYLLRTENGLSVFQTLIKSNPNIIQHITSHDLCISVNGYNSYYYLATCLPGCDILSYLLEQNHNLATQLSSDDLSVQFNISATKEYFTIFYFLCYYQKGRENLALLLRYNPELYNSISADVICRPAKVNYPQGSSENPPLFYLLDNPLGQEIFQQLLANPAIASNIPLSALTRINISGNSNELRCAPLYYLCNKPKLFKLLLDQNPAIAQGITATDLCLPIVNYERDKNCTPLLHLASKLAGQKILRTLLTSNPDLAKKISAKGLCLQIPNYNTSPFFFLCTCDLGRQLLTQFLNANPLLINIITPELICTAIVSAQYKKMSPFSLLCLQIEAHPLLKILIDHHANWTKKQILAVLCEPVIRDDQHYQSLLPLAELLVSAIGRDILILLSTKIPELLSAICWTKWPTEHIVNTNFLPSPLAMLQAYDNNGALLELLPQKLQKTSYLPINSGQLQTINNNGFFAVPALSSRIDDNALLPSVKNN